MSEESFSIQPKDFSWPDGSAKLFTEGAASRNTAWIHPASRDWSLYAVGYSAAYEILFEHWDSQKFRPDSLFYPIAFLCRHYIEIRLKDLLRMSQALLDLGSDWPQIHKLDVLWKKTRPLLIMIWPDGNEAELDHVEALILEFSKIDGGSFAFRYAVDKSGQINLPGLQQIDVSAMRRAMSQLSNFLDGACQGVSVYLEQQSGD